MCLGLMQCWSVCRSSCFGSCNFRGKSSGMVLLLVSQYTSGQQFQGALARNLTTVQKHCTMLCAGQPVRQNVVETGSSMLRKSRIINRHHYKDCFLNPKP